MITIRHAQERGHANHGWLDSHHTFSFSSYYDPAHMGFGDLRVINEDRVQGGMGFGTHSHQNMEIISYVLDGALEHKDSMGNGSTMRPGDVQLMSAGRGVAHSEFNGSTDELVHFLQIWVLPAKSQTEPGYQQRHYSEASRQNTWRLLVSPDGEQGSLKILQDMKLYGALLEPGHKLTYEPQAGRRLWVQVARGQVTLNGQTLRAGDGAAIQAEAAIGVEAQEAAELLLFDLR